MKLVRLVPAIHCSLSIKSRRSGVLIAALALLAALYLPALANGYYKIDLLTDANIQIDGAAAPNLAGVSVSSAGDVNGDGRDDVIVGAPWASNNGSGSAYVVFGASSTATVDLANLGSSGFRIDGAAAGDSAGYSVSDVGDMNGDGKDEVIVGAPNAYNGSGSGSAYVVFGKSSTGPVDLANLGSGGFRIDGAAAGDAAGASVSSAGDVNNDGLDDVIVGAYLADNNGKVSSGSAYVVFGKSSTETVSLANFGSSVFQIPGYPLGFRIDGAAFKDWAGWSVSSAGDLNDDGLGEVIVGAPLADSNYGINSGAAYIVFGKKTTETVDLTNIGTLQNYKGFRIAGAAAGNETGYSVSDAGDVNSDGRDDVIVGAPFASNNGKTDSGRAYVVFLTFPMANFNLANLGYAGYPLGFRIDGAATQDQTGRSVSSAGDVNSDGRDDVIVGAPGASNNGKLYSGSTYVVFGKSSTATVDLTNFGFAGNIEGFRIDGAATYDGAGYSVSDAGNVNGDGERDVIVGAPYAKQWSGSAYVVFDSPPCKSAPKFIVCPTKNR